MDHTFAQYPHRNHGSELVGIFPWIIPTFVPQRGQGVGIGGSGISSMLISKAERRPTGARQGGGMQKRHSEFLIREGRGTEGNGGAEETGSHRDTEARRKI